MRTVNINKTNEFRMHAFENTQEANEICLVTTLQVHLLKDSLTMRSHAASLESRDWARVAH